MFKKLTMVGIAVVLFGVLFAGRDAVSYVTTSVGKVRSAIRESVPVKFEIARAKKELENLGPDIRRNLESIAKEEVQLERLEKRINEMEAAQEDDKAAMMTLQADLRSGKKVFRYSGLSFTPDEVRSDLARKFNRFKTNDSTLESLQKVYKARAQKLDASRMKLDEMLAMRRQLELQLERIDAHREMVEVAQTAEILHFDDSKLGRVKELINELDTRLAVEDKLMEASDLLRDEIRPNEEENSGDIAEEVAKYFQNEKETFERETLAASAL